MRLRPNTTVRTFMLASTLGLLATGCYGDMAQDEIAGAESALMSSSFFWYISTEEGVYIEGGCNAENRREAKSTYENDWCQPGQYASCDEGEAGSNGWCNYTCNCGGGMVITNCTQWIGSTCVDGFQN